MGEKLLKVDEVAARLRVCSRTVLRMIEEGDIEAILVNPSSSTRNRYRILESELDNYIKRVGVFSGNK